MLLLLVLRFYKERVSVDHGINKKRFSYLTTFIGKSYIKKDHVVNFKD